MYVCMLIESVSVCMQGQRENTYLAYECTALFGLSCHRRWPLVSGQTGNIINDWPVFISIQQKLSCKNNTLLLKGNIPSGCHTPQEHKLEIIFF